MPLRSALLPHSPGFKLSEADLVADLGLLDALMRFHVVPDRVLAEAQVGAGWRRCSGSAT